MEIVVFVAPKCAQNGDPLQLEQATLFDLLFQGHWSQLPFNRRDLWSCQTSSSSRRQGKAAIHNRWRRVDGLVFSSFRFALNQRYVDTAATRPAQRGQDMLRWNSWRNNAGMSGEEWIQNAVTWLCCLAEEPTVQAAQAAGLNVVYYFRFRIQQASANINGWLNAMLCGWELVPKFLNIFTPNKIRLKLINVKGSQQRIILPKQQRYGTPDC